MAEQPNRTPEELGRLYPIFLVPYDPDWPARYEREAARVRAVLGGIAGRMEHIGSTAVPGLAAKPTVDIAVEIPGDFDGQDIRRRMESGGYIPMAQQRSHLMFVRGYGPGGLEKESFHIHMGPAGLDFLWDRVFFRDYLRTHPEAAAAYEALKGRLARQFPHDREAYTDAKAEFVAEITQMAKEAVKG